MVLSMSNAQEAHTNLLTYIQEMEAAKKAALLNNHPNTAAVCQTNIDNCERRLISIKEVAKANHTW